MTEKYLSVLSNKKEVLLDTSTIIYVHMDRNIAKIHTADNQIYNIRLTLQELEKKAWFRLY